MVVAEEKQFLCGVVEGFYGRPWTCDQRKELFSRMRVSSMNTYIYAPKDDVKHRALWRQLYTKPEEMKIKHLIDAARAEETTFVYAISPGLDISFASSADVTALKRKMKQVSKLGCTAFALLFDDINPMLKPSDAAVFKSSAHAQASVTNEVFTYLKEPKFLFCPTEYCKTRTIPCVEKSEYLNTLGNELYSDIDIMWTGDKVIPEIITKESIRELGAVLKRKPVIWDNIHANDYDQRRVYLGAYSGRSVQLYPYLNGILTNPNCEFEANYVAIHTLGTWCRVAAQTYANHHQQQQQQGNESYEDVQMADLSYDESSNDYIASPMEDCEMNEPEMLPSLTAADVRSVVSEYNSDMSENSSIIPEYNADEALKLALNDWYEEFSLKKKAPLKSYSKRNLKSTVVNGQTVLSAVPYDLDMVKSTLDTISGMKEDKCKFMALSHDDLFLLTDLFCLPYQHGESGNRLLEDFQWLVLNVTDIYEQPPSKEKVSCWFDRLLRCDEQCQRVMNLFENFCKIPNEAILYDLYPYLWDIKEVVLCLNSYVHWLSDSINSNLSIDIIKDNHKPIDYLLLDPPSQRHYTEPWHIRYLGGLTVALHKLLPFKGGYLYLDLAPDVPSNKIIRSRSYSASDRDTLYAFCALECDNDDVVDLEKSELPGDREVGPYLSICPKTFFVVEDEEGQMCGYVAAVPNNYKYLDSLHNNYIPHLKDKYGHDDVITPTLSTDESWRSTTSSTLVLKFTSECVKECVRKRILNSVFSVVKACGSKMIYYELKNEEEFDFYLKLGFCPVDMANERLLCRAL